MSVNHKVFGNCVTYIPTDDHTYALVTVTRLLIGGTVTKAISRSVKLRLNFSGVSRSYMKGVKVLAQGGMLWECDDSLPCCLGACGTEIKQPSAVSHFEGNVHICPFPSDEAVSSR